MKFDPQKHQRRSMRLAEYDYSRAGAYFVTIVTWQRAPIFGQIQNGAAVLTRSGIIAREEWFKTAGLRPNVRLDEAEFVVMPNHVHGILWIVGEEDGGGCDVARVGAQRRCAPTKTTTNGMDFPNGIVHNDACGGTSVPMKPPLTKTNVMSNSLGAIVRGFKSAVTYRINALYGRRGAAVWQRNYYEHVIRDQEECESIRAYIQANPLRWVEDGLHPGASDLTAK